MNKRYYNKIFSYMLPILFAAICMVVLIESDAQSIMPIPYEINFEGEYSYDGENWYPYSKNANMSALDGDIIVKGHLDIDIEEGAVLNFFCNHIGTSMYLNGERLYIDAAAELSSLRMDLLPSMCGKRWEQVSCPEITTEDEIIIEMINCHAHGNKGAYLELMDNILITPPDIKVLEAYLKLYTKPFAATGYGFIIVSMMLLGASLSATIMKSATAERLFKFGITTLFAGGYMVFDIMMISIMNEQMLIKSCGRQLCMMLAVYFAEWIMSDYITGKEKQIAGTAIKTSCIFNLVMIGLAITKQMLLFDVQYYWVLTQLIICPLLLILLVLEMLKERKIIMSHCLYIVILVAILMDFAGVGYHTFYPGICSKVAFLFVFLIFIVRAARQVIFDHQEAMKNKLLKEELENNRITMMLSQIKPHFLYNALTSVMYLCDNEPKEAKRAIADFADYLRGNLSALSTEKLIPFQMELAHTEKYLRLEKLRFQEELKICYDIHTKDFSLPVLTMQPLVENAVKHGVGKKTGGGTVTIHTSETDTDYLIRIEDDGVGFELGEYSDDKDTHIGLENIKNRLRIMANARLEILSKKGEGTTATIWIPKE